MGIRARRHNLSPLLARAKALLLMMSVILIVANLYFLSSTRQLAESYSARQNQATWFLFQLTKEFSELTAITPFAASNKNHHEKTLLKYELTWSRFDLLLNSREADTFINLPGARTFFSTLFINFQALESQLTSINDPTQAKLLSQQLSNLYLGMIQYINTNFRIQSPLYRDQMMQAQMLHQSQIALLLLLALCASLAGYIIHIEAKHHRQLSLTDSLTKVNNRLALFIDLERFVEHDKEFTLYLLDLNGFKQINDKYGHQAGDKALKEIARRLLSLKLPCYRIGGDEFALIELDSMYRKPIWQEIEACFDHRVEITDKNRALLSTSIGVASYPKDTNQINQLISIADKNMYRMKFKREEPQRKNA
ncbi:GGDEF domain-containing protein [Vibrio atypicus]|uniref:GGDEF domain-containing protein n=1 Tax=Vibrio atypicus TaxID=558271 RepID=UPI00135BD2DE|nr:GGDEF domain-containing protein [Vibrio atypicus]